MPTTAKDHFEYPNLTTSDLKNPITSWVAVTPSDTDELAFVSRRIAILDNGTVNVRLQMRDDPAALDWTITGPVELDWRVRKVLATGTTATKIRVGQ